MTTNEVQAIIAEADLNGDGKLDYAEFCHMLSNTANQCVRANHQKWAQTLEHWPPRSQVSRRRSLERRDQHRDEIRKHLYSAESNKYNSTPMEGSIQSGRNRSMKEVQSNFESAQVPLSRLDPEEVDLPSAAAQNKSSGAELQPHSSGELPLAPGEDPLPTKLPPLKKVSLPSALQPPSSGGIEYTDGSKNSTKSQVEQGHGEEGGNIVACGENHQQHEIRERDENHKTHEARQTDHLLAKGLSPLSADNRDVQADEKALNGKEEPSLSSDTPPLSKDGKEEEEEEPSLSMEGNEAHCAEGKGGGVDCHPTGVKERGLDSPQSDMEENGGVPKMEGVSSPVSPSSVVTSPPRKPTDTEVSLCTYCSGGV